MAKRKFPRFLFVSEPQNDDGTYCATVLQAELASHSQGPLVEKLREKLLRWLNLVPEGVELQRAELAVGLDADLAEVLAANWPTLTEEQVRAIDSITQKCEQYWNEPNICDAEIHAALGVIHARAMELKGER